MERETRTIEMEKPHRIQREYSNAERLERVYNNGKTTETIKMERDYRIGETIEMEIELQKWRDQNYRNGERLKLQNWRTIEIAV